MNMAKCFEKDFLNKFKSVFPKKMKNKKLSYCRNFKEIPKNLEDRKRISKEMISRPPITHFLD